MDAKNRKIYHVFYDNSGSTTAIELDFAVSGKLVCKEFSLIPRDEIQKPSMRESEIKLLMTPPFKDEKARFREFDLVLQK